MQAPHTVFADRLKRRQSFQRTPRPGEKEAFVPDDDDLFDDEELEPQADDSSVIKDLRRRLREASRRAKDAEQLKPEYEALKEFKQQVETEKKVSQTQSVFEQTGISPKLAPLFLKEHEGEVTEGAVLAWAQGYDLGPKVEEEPEKPAFRPTAAGQPPSNLMSRSDFKVRLADPATRDEALEAYSKGRVEPLT